MRRPRPTGACCEQNKQANKQIRNHIGKQYFNESVKEIVCTRVDGITSFGFAECTGNCIGIQIQREFFVANYDC
jgi:hypothetical protein